MIISDFHAEKHRQLHIILAIIVCVFSACVVILVAYMVIFPASYTEVDIRPRESLSGPSKNKEEENSKVEDKVWPHYLTLHDFEMATWPIPSESPEWWNFPEKQDLGSINQI